MKKFFLDSRDSPMRDASWALVGVSMLLGYAAKPPARPPPQAPATAAAPGVRVLLLWSAPVDLDLYVTDASLETVYFANPVSHSGGRLERDVTCETVADGEKAQPLVEEIGWE
jgi:hypothetical protein